MAYLRLKKRDFREMDVLTVDYYSRGLIGTNENIYSEIFDKSQKFLVPFFREIDFAKISRIAISLRENGIFWMGGQSSANLFLAVNDISLDGKTELFLFGFPFKVLPEQEKDFASLRNIFLSRIFENYPDNLKIRDGRIYFSVPLDKNPIIFTYNSHGRKICITHEELKKMTGILRIQ